MNDVTTALTTKTTPSCALIMYNSGYIERRYIKDGVMQEGVPLSEDFIRDLVSAVSVEEANLPHGAIPANMIYADPRTGHEKYIWYRHAEKRKVYFSDQTGIPNGEMWVPPLVYQVQGMSLSVYAFTGGKPKDKLFRAPFLNVSDTYVCLGNTDIEFKGERSYERIMEHWEKAFWNSEFTHLLGGNPIKSNLASLTKELIETGKRFPVKELVESDTTLEKLMR